MKFNAHLDTMFAGQTPEQKIKQFAELGFDGYELWCHWQYDIDELVKLNQKYHLKTVAVATEFIPLTDPAKRTEYLAGLDRAVAACKKLGCPVIISQVGNLLAAPSAAEQQQSIVDGLRLAAPKLAGTGMVLAVEPLNTLVDHAGYFLERSDVAAQILAAVNAKEVKLLFDIYHQQITEGNLINNIVKYLPLVAHFHVADTPGRHQPGSGEINYHNVFAAIDKAGYTGYAGLEFFPQGDTLTVLQKFNLDYRS